MNKLLIALCLTASFGVIANVNLSDALAIATAQHNNAIINGIESCGEIKGVIKSLGGKIEMQDLVEEICIESQDLIKRTTATKLNIEKELNKPL